MGNKKSAHTVHPGKSLALQGKEIAAGLLNQGINSATGPASQAASVVENLYSGFGSQKERTKTQKEEPTKPPEKEPADPIAVSEDELDHLFKSK